MATIRLKKGYDLNLKGRIVDPAIASSANSALYAIVPDDFVGLVPRMDKREGDHVSAGEPLFHDKSYAQIQVTSPVSGVVKEVRRGQRRHIDAIVIEPDGKAESVKHDTGGDVQSVLLASGLWAMLRQRPYDIVPSPEVRPRDIFVTGFDSAPLAPDLAVVLGDDKQYLKKGVEVLKRLTDGDVYLGFKAGEELDVPGAVVNTFKGPHPAGNAGVQLANVKPVNKGEVVWTLDIVTLARIGRLFSTGTVSYDTVVAVTGECVAKPHYVRATMGCQLSSLLGGTDTADTRIISGNALSGYRVGVDDYLRAPYRHVTVIPELSKPDEFMGWASLSPSRFSIYHTFTSWLAGKREVSMDARVKGGERAIVRTDEYDDMLPMDIYAEFLIKAIITFDIDKMEQLGVYEIAPEDFALAEYACTSKLELQRIVREGLDRLHSEMS